VKDIHAWTEVSIAPGNTEDFKQLAKEMIALGGFSRFEIHGDLSPEAEQLVGALATAKFGYLNGIER
jgi:hypothetical protein